MLVAIEGPLSPMGSDGLKVKSDLEETHEDFTQGKGSPGRNIGGDGSRRA